MTQRIAITPGEPAGVGPDLIITIAQQDWPVEMVVIASKTLLQERAKALSLPLTLIDYDQDAPAKSQQAGSLTVLDVKLAEPCVPGMLNSANGSYVVETLRIASEKNISGEFDAIVTAQIGRAHV